MLRGIKAARSISLRGKPSQETLHLLCLIVWGAREGWAKRRCEIEIGNLPVERRPILTSCYGAVPAALHRMYDI